MSSGKEGAGDGRLNAAALAFVLFCAALAFGPVTGFEFLYWDDPLYVTQNTWIRSLSRENLYRFFSAPLEGIYQPLTWIFYAFQYKLGELNPRVFHTFSLFFHLANTALVYFFLRLLDRRLATPLLGALVFALHPQRVETVAWVSAQKDLVCTAFFLGSLIAWLCFRERPSTAGYLSCFSLFVLACLAKSMAVTIPLLLLAIDWYQGRKDYKKALAEKLPFFAVSLFIGFMAIAAREEFEPLLREFTYNPSYRIFSASYRLVYYHLARFFYPWLGGEMLYPRWEDLSGGVPLSYVLLAPALLAILLLTYVFIRRFRDLALMTFFFFLTIFPTIGIISVGSSADRYNYLPSAALSSLFALLVTKILSRIKIRSALRASVLLGGICVFVLSYGYGAYKMTFNWKDDISFLGHVIDNFPETSGHASNKATAYLDRGWVYLGRGDPARALSDFDESLRLKPGNAPAYKGRGIALEQTGDVPGAIDSLNKSLESGFETPDTYAGLAALYLSAGELPAALESARRAAALGYPVPPELAEKIRTALEEKERTP
ncbi:tetratricopeptide repeat protein [bacterium]|nr:MAG: tetratricopeptide repeat protein [bacterium]